jgi:hypothetical protein
MGRNYYLPPFTLLLSFLSALIKKTEIFLIYEEGSVAKSSTQYKGFLLYTVYEEMLKYLTNTRRSLVIYDFATDPF